MTDFSKQLSKYIPLSAASIVSQWINHTGCRFKVTRSRSTKLGDYTAPFQGNPHQITVNHDLNPYSFLITTIHEFAHLKTYQEHKNKVKPHGIEWKQNFKLLMAPFLQLSIFPADIQEAISRYMNNPSASSCTDLTLYRVLKLYDANESNGIPIEEIKEQAVFSLKNGRIFKKLEKLRKRYKCIELVSNRVYLFHPLVEVYLVKD